jgi:hypothetical protein
MIHAHSHHGMIDHVHAIAGRLRHRVFHVRNMIVQGLYIATDLSASLHALVCLWSRWQPTRVRSDTWRCRQPPGIHIAGMGWPFVGKSHRLVGHHHIAPCGPCSFCRLRPHAYASRILDPVPGKIVPGQSTHQIQSAKKRKEISSVRQATRAMPREEITFCGGADILVSCGFTILIHRRREEREARGRGRLSDILQSRGHCGRELSVAIGHFTSYAI